MKTHKQGNPLHPIISQIPAPTYQLSKRLNTILTPYVPGDHSLKSSAKFPEALRVTSPGGITTLMDMESLFTNVPVTKTIQMILDHVYKDPTTPSLNTPGKPSVPSWRFVPKWPLSPPTEAICTPKSTAWRWVHQFLHGYC